MSEPAMPSAFVVGQVVPLTFEVSDADGYARDATAYTLTMRHESLAEQDLTSYVQHPETGTYTLDFATTTPGFHLAVFTATGSYPGRVTRSFTVDALDLALITLVTLKEYLKTTSASDAQILAALAAERAAQVQACYVDPYTMDLREALLRRVARNLAARAVPVATFTSFEGGATSTRVPGRDVEVDRLEGPYRRFGFA